MDAHAQKRSGHIDGAPLSLLHYLKHAKILHQRVVLLSVVTEDVPHVPNAERLVIAQLRRGFWQVIGRYGFMESASVPRLMQLAKDRERESDGATFFLRRESVVPGRGWRERLFSLMHHNARPAAELFGIPPNQVLEIGAQIEL